MLRQLSLWLVLGSTIGAAFGFLVGKSDPMAPLIVGGIGAGLGLAGFLVVIASNKVWQVDNARVNSAAAIGATVGAIMGGILGPLTRLGNFIILKLHPDLVGEDVVEMMGVCGGVLIGAFLGACIFAMVLPAIWKPA